MVSTASPNPCISHPPWLRSLHSFLSYQRTAAESFWLQHQEGPGRRGSAQSDPAAPARGGALPPAGDTRRMGHRDSPKEFGRARGVCGADGGFAASAEERVRVEPSILVRAALFALRF